MSTDYEPGTVAVATVRGVKGVRVFLADPKSDEEWTSAGLVGDRLWHKDGHLTDVRPLVVLDLGDYDNRAVTYLRNIARGDLGVDGNPSPRAKLVNLIADQIEALTKPPRIPEPGWGAVIREYNGSGFPWTRFSDSESHNEGDWINHDATRRQWDDLIDPVLIREGLS